MHTAYLDCLLDAQGQRGLRTEIIGDELVTAPGEYVVVDRPRKYFGSACCYHFRVRVTGGTLVREWETGDGFYAWRCRHMRFAPGDSVSYDISWANEDLSARDPECRYRGNVRFASPEHTELLRRARDARLAAEAREVKAALDAHAAEQAADSARVRERHDAWAAEHPGSDTVFERPPRGWAAKALCQSA